MVKNQCKRRQLVSERLDLTAFAATNLIRIKVRRKFSLSLQVIIIVLDFRRIMPPKYAYYQKASVFFAL